MAPGAIFADHIAMKLVTVKPTSPEALAAAGCRLDAAGQQRLLALIAAWQERHASTVLSQGGASQPSAAAAAARGGGGEEVLLLPAGVFRGAKWPLAPVPKGGKPAAWEKSYDRFARGQPPDAIALSQESGLAAGKAIQASTVVGHIFSAVQAGKPVELQRLAVHAPPPSRDEWEQLADAEARTGVDVVKDDKLNKTNLLAAFLPEAEKKFDERTERDKALLAHWFPLVDWYVSLRRVGHAPSFGHDLKRQRAA